MSDLKRHQSNEKFKNAENETNNKNETMNVQINE